MNHAAAIPITAHRTVTTTVNLTVFHNGILVHLAVEFPGKFGPFDLHLQDHGNPVRFRNIWVREIKEPEGKPGKKGVEGK